MVYELWVTAWSTKYKLHCYSFSIFQSLTVIGYYTFVIQFTYRQQSVCWAAFLRPNDKSIQHGYSKEEVSQKRWKHSTETKCDDTGVKPVVKCKWSYRDLVDCGNGDNAASGHLRDSRYPVEELSEGVLVIINKESGC